MRVDLLSGGAAGQLWPRPGRLFAVSPRHTFHTFAEAIDDAFARWDRSHLHEFHLPDGRTVTEWRYLDDVEPGGELDADTETLERLLQPGDELGYVFDLGEDWRHQCVIGPDLIDAADEIGTVPPRPLPIWGWGAIPDPYGRLFDHDDGHTPIPTPPRQPWPCVGAPPPSVVTESVPRQYTRTRNVAQESR
ncbi:hypothetical protein [Actinoplanes sp. NPDC049681]|uniref:IS1096 element passenger TnpR family protein n=1 Tax=Actinoplanes sp. NPDC049681 TaxID=3363905 RepID=UPI0037B601D5